MEPGGLPELRKCCWGGRVTSPEFSGQGTKEKKAAQRAPEICRGSTLTLHLGTDENFHVRKRIKFGDRTIGMD